MKKRIIIISSAVLGALALLLLGLLIFVIFGNTCLEVSEFEIKDSDLPSSFDGFKIAQVSDLHNTEFGRDNKRLLKKLRDMNPDIIAITGDLVDSRKTDLQVALDFVRGAMEIAPCYYVTGNHEGRIDDFEAFEIELASLGVIILDNASVEIEKSNQKIELHGLHDLESLKGERYGYSEGGVAEKLLKENEHDKDGYDILLAHYPDFLDLYAKHEYDLVLSGHAHGGQFRLPIVGGLYAPLQGIFPEYDGGIYTEGATNMIVSRGLGNSAFPFRFNNTPEIVLVTLTK